MAQGVDGYLFLPFLLVPNVWTPAQVVQISFRRMGRELSFVWSLFIEIHFLL